MAIPHATFTQKSLVHLEPPLNFSTRRPFLMLSAQLEKPGFPCQTAADRCTRWYAWNTCVEISS